MGIVRMQVPNSPPEQLCQVCPQLNPSESVPLSIPTFRPPVRPRFTCAYSALESEFPGC